MASLMMIDDKHESNHNEKITKNLRHPYFSSTKKPTLLVSFLFIMNLIHRRSNWSIIYLIRKILV